MVAGNTSKLDLSQIYDVLVIGGGNAALCAAMTARETGAGVLLLECAPRHFRGGNSRHTRNLRYLHEQGGACLTGPYLEDEFWEDLLRVTGGLQRQRLEGRLCPVDGQRIRLAASRAICWASVASRCA